MISGTTLYTIFTFIAIPVLVIFVMSAVVLRND